MERNPGRCVTAAVVLVLAVVAARQVSAWGATGHRIIGRLAVAGLPADLPAFLRSGQSIEAAGELAREPDRWKGSGLVHDSDRARSIRLNEPTISPVP